MRGMIARHRHAAIAAAAALAPLFATTPSHGARREAAPTAAEVRNAEVCLPALGEEGDHVVKLEGGQYSGPGIPFAEMRALAVGRVARVPSAVAEIVWNTGGSGNWEIVALFERTKGKLVCRGVYSPGSNLPDGGTMVERIEIRDDRIDLYGADPQHGRSIAQPLRVTRDAFTRCGVNASREGG